jgi:small subunit ribosomal protein S20
LANIKSAKKRVLVSRRKAARNRVARSAVKTRIVRARRAIDGAMASTADELKAAVASLDRAAEKGILHRKNTARRKSRLMRLASRQAALAADPEAAARAAAEARTRAKGAGKARAGGHRAATTRTRAAKKSS